MVIANPGKTAIHHGTGVRSHGSRRYLVRYVEPKHVQELVQHPQVGAVRRRQFQTDHQEGLEGLHPPHLADVGLIDAVDESGVDLVVAAVELVFREGQTLEDEQLGEVDHYGGVGGGEVLGVDDPLAVYGYVEGS